MEELTPPQRKLQEEIQKRVRTLKFIRSHVRWAGIVAQFAGIFLHNTAVMLLGTFVFLSTYMITASIMEDITILVWDRPDEPKNEEDENAE